jgi:hypothetical protein
MLTPHVPSTSRLGGLDRLGLGLFLGGPGAVWFGHSGGNEGVRCHLLAHRDAGCGLVVMTNGDRGHTLIGELLDDVAQALDWPDYVVAEPDGDTAPSVALDALAGVYELRPGAVIEVMPRGDDLVVAALEQPAIRFLRVGEAEFGSFAVETTLAFELVDGRAEALVVRQNDGELRCPRVG